MKKFMHSLITASVLSGAVILFTVQIVAPTLPPFVGPPDVNEAKFLKLPPASKLRIVNADGPVKVDTHPRERGGEIEINANVRIYVRDDAAIEDARTYAKGLVMAHGSEDLLEIITEPGDRPFGYEMVVAYSIRVPWGTDIEVIGPNGNVAIAEGCGQVAVLGGNSDIEIVQPGGMVVAKSDNGRIRLIDARDDARLEAVNGSIFANMREGSLEAATTNGHIVAHVLSPAVDLFELSTQNGSITVTLPMDSPFLYDARTDRGIIRSDFALDLGVGVLDSKHVQGSVGEGGPVLTLDTLNGNIWLKRKRS